MGKQTFHRPKSVARDRNRSGSMISSIDDDALQKCNNLHLLQLSEEFGACGRVIEGSDVVHGGGHGILLVDASHLHTKVTCFNDDHDALWCQGLFDAMCYLLCHAFLHLQTMAVDVNDACEFGKACDLAIRDVGDVHLPKEGQQMVLAEGIEFYVLHDDHIVVGLLEECRAQDGHGIFVVASGEFRPGTSHPARCLDKPFARRVFAQQ